MQTPVPVGGPPWLPGTSVGPAGPGAMEGMFSISTVVDAQLVFSFTGVMPYKILRAGASIFGSN